MLGSMPPLRSTPHAAMTVTAAKAELARARQQSDEQAADHSAGRSKLQTDLVVAQQRTKAADTHARCQAEAAAEARRATAEADAQRGRAELACQVITHVLGLELYKSQQGQAPHRYV
jgi:hypothetical protein